jgi:hypothetical protein
VVEEFKAALNVVFGGTTAARFEGSVFYVLSRIGLDPFLAAQHPIL